MYKATFVVKKMYYEGKLVRDQRGEFDQFNNMATNPKGPWVNYPEDEPVSEYRIDQFGYRFTFYYKDPDDEHLTPDPPHSIRIMNDYARDAYNASIGYADQSSGDTAKPIGISVDGRDIRRDVRKIVFEVFRPRKEDRNGNPIEDWDTEPIITREVWVGEPPKGTSMDAKGFYYDEKGMIKVNYLPNIGEKNIYVKFQLYEDGFAVKPYDRGLTYQCIYYKDGKKTSKEIKPKEDDYKRHTIYYLLNLGPLSSKDYDKVEVKFFVDGKEVGSQTIKKADIKIVNGSWVNGNDQTISNKANEKQIFYKFQLTEDGVPLKDKKLASVWEFDGYYYSGGYWYGYQNPFKSQVEILDKSEGEWYYFSILNASGESFYRDYKAYYWPWNGFSNQMTLYLYDANSVSIGMPGGNVKAIPLAQETINLP